jgi:5-(carboxyamino)imidazole ribonucleotide synthase
MKCQRVGVIGGGQLAWMMAAAAPNLGIELLVQTPQANDPAVSRAKEVIFSAIDDAEATAKLAASCDVITFENEFINLEALKKLEQQGVCFRPNLGALSPLLDKYHQRSFLQQIGLPVPRFEVLTSTTDITNTYGLPLVLKARRHGYDGQGTFIIDNQQDLEAVLRRIPASELLLEEFIPFEKELGIIVGRNVSGEVAIYPVVETYQKNQVCHWVIAPAEIPPEIETEVKAIARTLMEKLEVVGVFGIELFLTKDNRVLVNEIAPRTHNSGHYTLDGCDTSQFEMQLRAVTDLPLGSTAFKADGALMVNLLGYEDSETDYQTQRDRISAMPNAYVQWYGKTSRSGRKLGHVTVLLQRKEFPQAKAIIQQIESIWYGEN